METMTEVTETVRTLVATFKAETAAANGDHKAYIAAAKRYEAGKGKGLMVLRSNGKLTKARADDFFSGSRFFTVAK